MKVTRDGLTKALCKVLLSVPLAWALMVGLMIGVIAFAEGTPVSSILTAEQMEGFSIAGTVVGALLVLVFGAWMLTALVLTTGAFMADSVFFCREYWRERLR
jgi:hypothetical protein